MNKMMLVTVFIVTISCYADSLFRYVIVGDNYNPEGLVLGKYGPEFLWGDDIMFPVEDYENIKKKKPQFDEATNKKLKELNDVLMAALDKDPKQEKFIAELTAIEDTAMKQWEKTYSKVIEEKMFPTESYSRIIQIRPAEIIKSSAYQELLEEFRKFYKACLPKVEKVEREIIEELKKRNMEPTGEWFSGMPGVAYKEVPQDIISKFTDQLKEIGVIDSDGKVKEFKMPALTKECEEQFEAIVIKIVNMLEYDSQIVAATEKYKKAIIDRSYYGGLYRNALKRELGIEKVVKGIKSSVEEKIKELKLREKLEKIRKDLSPDILKAQQEYDVAVDLFIDKAEKEIEKVLAERKAQKATPSVAVS